MLALFQKSKPARPGQTAVIGRRRRDDNLLVMRSNILDVVSSEVAVVDASADGFGVAAGSRLLPVGVQSAGGAGHEDVAGGEAVELLEVGRAALALEGLEEDQVLAVLERGVLDVLDGLEEGRRLALDVPLLLGLVAALAMRYLYVRFCWRNLDTA